MLLASKSTMASVSVVEDCIQLKVILGVGWLGVVSVSGPAKPLVSLVMPQVSATQKS